MIFLISLFSCNNDKSEVLFNGNELVEYRKITDDFEAPKYKWGYLNKNGELAISDRFDDLREFNEGKAAYNIGGLWGYLNKDGSVFLKARYRTVVEYSEGKAIVQDLNNRYHIIDENKEIVSDSLNYEKVNKLKSGRALVKDAQRYGYLDETGNVTIEMDYEYATDFFGGMAIVTKNRKQGIIDVNGQEIIPIQYDKIWLPKSNIIRYKDDNKYGFIDYDTKESVYSQYHSATDFQSDHAIVNNGDKYLVLSKSGKTKSLPYSLVDNGGEGKWMYALNASYGFLSNDGTVLCPANYDLVMRYKEDRAGFAINDIWGYLDEKGEIVIAPKYPLVWDFVDGYARMIGRTGFGYINKDGEDILPAQYMEIRDFSEGLARIQVYR